MTIEIPQNPLPIVVAHRGGTEFNTEEGLQAYAELRKYGILQWECDIQFDKFNVPFLMHDDTIDRTTTGTGQCDDIDVLHTAARLDDGHLIPTLARFLEYALLRGAYCYIEPKHTPTIAQATTVINLIHSYEMGERCVLQSASKTILNVYRGIDKIDIGYSLNTGNTIADVKAYGDMHFQQLSITTFEEMQAFKDAGISVIGWMADTPEDWTLYKEWPLYAIASNRPVAFQCWRDWTTYGQH